MMALCRRLVSTWPIRSASMTTGRGLGGISPWTVRRAASAWGLRLSRISQSLRAKSLGTIRTWKVPASILAKSKRSLTRYSRRLAPWLSWRTNSRWSWVRGPPSSSSRNSA
ncbi:hypothetical protein D3C86_1573020 [compost metagenome]